MPNQRFEWDAPPASFACCDDESAVLEELSDR